MNEGILSHNFSTVLTKKPQNPRDSAPLKTVEKETSAPGDIKNKRCFSDIERTFLLIFLIVSFFFCLSSCFCEELAGVWFCCISDSLRVNRSVPFNASVTSTNKTNLSSATFR